jgi:hypothetical protein
MKLKNAKDKRFFFFFYVNQFGVGALCFKAKNVSYLTLYSGVRFSGSL